MVMLMIKMVTYHDAFDFYVSTKVTIPKASKPI